MKAVILKSQLKELIKFTSSYAYIELSSFDEERRVYHLRLERPNDMIFKMDLISSTDLEIHQSISGEVEDD